MRHRKIYTLIAALAVPLVLSTADARQFRSIQPIVTPVKAALLPDGAQPVDSIQAVPREVIAPALKDLLVKWNAPGMSDTLTDGFFDKNRLLDTMSSSVPRDAKLSVLAVRGIQTVQQYITPADDGGRGTLVSLVTVTVQTQVEFNSPTSGYTRLPGTNEFLLEVTTAAPPR